MLGTFALFIVLPMKLPLNILFLFVEILFIFFYFYLILALYKRKKFKKKPLRKRWITLLQFYNLICFLVTVQYVYDFVIYCNFNIIVLHQLTQLRELSSWIYFTRSTLKMAVTNLLQYFSLLFLSDINIILF